MMSSSTTDLFKDNQVAPAEDTAEKTMPGDTGVAYKPVTMDKHFEVDDSGHEQSASYGKNRKACIIIVICVAVVVLILVPVIIIAIRPWNRGEPFVYEIIPTNVTADLYIVEYPANATIETDIEESIDKLYRNSVFAEVYNQTVVLGVKRGSEPVISVLIIFSDLGDDLGSPTGDSDDATDVFDFFLDALRDNAFEGFDVSRWTVRQSS